MQITICRLYDTFAHAKRVLIALEAAGIPPQETSLISNNSDNWYRPLKTTALSAPSISSTKSRIEGAGIGAAIGATAATAASLVTMLALPGVGAVVGTGALVALLGSVAAGGVTGGLLGALTSAGVSEDDAQVIVEGVRRGGTLVTARVDEADVPRASTEMNRSAVDLQQRRDLYRKSGWESFDPSAAPYTAAQVRCERVLHAAH